MRSRIAVLGAAALVAVATSASAQQTQTQTYAYDVHGRLTDVTRSGGGSTQTTSYVLDKADNRVNRTTGAPVAGRSTANAALGEGPSPQGARGAPSTPNDPSPAPSENEL
ncbi:hypothetical protein D3C87_1850680 [compost metagenome]